MHTETDSDVREMLLKNVKKEVKKIMEESVTKKFVHEDSGSVTLLCAAIESCLLHGLKKRALGLFKDSSTTALLDKVGKTFEPGAAVLKRLKEKEKDPDSRRMSAGSVNRESGQRYPWIRLALFDKKLIVIVDHLMSNCSKYYEKEALMADPVDSLIFASLLVGPCSLEYSKIKIADHYWTDPTASELIQRHRIHTSAKQHGLLMRGGSPQRPALRIQRHLSSTSSEDSSSRSLSGSATPPTVKEYVLSLHQNARSVLLYGKNNVSVQPNNDVELLAGYLSLHQDGDQLSVKWTPNQLMNGCSEEVEDPPPTKSLYWDHALSINLDEIVYIHCHRQADGGGILVLVGQDGVQRPPLHFPRGGHLLAFLSCVETGLMPLGHLEPPLWYENGTGKVFPKLRRKSSRILYSSSLSSQSSESSFDAVPADNDEEETDYVFHIVASTGQNYSLPEESETEAQTGSVDTWNECESMQKLASDEDNFNSGSTSSLADLDGNRVVVEQLCHSMKGQIISRAFYGWLLHCRHLKTVRTHLSGLVNTTVFDALDSSKRLTDDVWRRFHSGSDESYANEIYKLVYNGGCDHHLRKEVWPYLLGYYKFGATQEKCAAQDEAARCQYENTVSEWLAVEAIVTQCDHEAMEANIARLSAEQNAADAATAASSAEAAVRAAAAMLEVVDEGVLTDEPGTTAADGGLQAAATTVQQDGQSCGSRTRLTDDGFGGSLSSDGSSKQEDTPISLHGDDSSSDAARRQQFFVVTNPTVDDTTMLAAAAAATDSCIITLSQREDSGSASDYLVLEASPAVSNASSGGVYSPEFLDSIAINIHRIDKDVQRCDRNYSYFTVAGNLDKLRNIMCTYVWENIEVGYVQGMCDLAAPLLVIFDDESKTYGCFCELMKRMTANFPHGGTTMDDHFDRMRLLIQVLDPELFEHLSQNGEFSHFYFCYRWFLLDFKRELVYDDVFTVWETIWAAQRVSSANLVLFIALALVEFYREIIIDNNMDFTDTIRFFNEMAEQHDVKQILQLARKYVANVQDMIYGK